MVMDCAFLDYLLLRLLVILWMSSLSSCYSFYQLELPNGDNVPHPCKVNYRWPGLGHLNPYGGGPRNPFGEAFQKAGYKWTHDLCIQDSDGDGSTNGQELGDPSCIWTKGRIPASIMDITHPGVCEPIDSPQCQGQNNFVDCHLQEFENCSRIKVEGVQNLTLRFPKNAIPAKETSYYCMSFDLPRDQDYHILAYEPVIDNRDAMHHILLYGCNSKSPIRFNQPTTCGMNAESLGCYDIIGAWTVGSPGMCLPETVGYRMGNTSYQRALMQIHWNNPRFVQNYTDSSGLRIYYQPATPNISDLAMFMVGQMILEIPPGETNVVHQGICPGSCTSQIFSRPINIVTGMNHMHYLGRIGKVEVFRNGTKVTDLTYDPYYSYDSPTTHVHNPPIQVLPGDELKATCVYNSVSSSHYVYFGESTQEEMCVMFLTVYPATAIKKNRTRNNCAKCFYQGCHIERSLFPNCVQVGPLNACDRVAGKPYEGCDWISFTSLKGPNITYFVESLMANCSLDGFCRPECQQVRREIAQHPCMKGEIVKLINMVFSRTQQGLQFLVRYNSCQDEDIRQPGKETCPKQCEC